MGKLGRFKAKIAVNEQIRVIMRTVIDRSDVPSAFGHPVAIDNPEGKFEFVNYTVTLDEKKNFTVPVGTHPITVLGQIAEAQQYAFSCFVSSPGDASHGGVLNRFTFYRDLNVIGLGERGKAELGVNWIGSISSRTGVPIDYGVPPDQWRGMRPDPSR